MPAIASEFDILAEATPSTYFVDDASVLSKSTRSDLNKRLSFLEVGITGLGPARTAGSSRTGSPSGERQVAAASVPCHTTVLLSGHLDGGLEHQLLMYVASRCC